jgi:apolipoprotein N-acyltransferase
MIITVIVRRKCFDKGLVLGLAGLALIGYLLKQIQWTDAIGDPIKVSVIQGNISQDRKWQPEFKSKTLELYRELTFQHSDSQVIIWPETAVPALLHEVDEYYLQPLHQQARKHKADLVVSLPVKDSERGRYFNAVLALGESRSIYKKIHLLPFGEYMPFQPLSGWILDSLKILPIGSFTPGAKDQPLLEAGGYPFIITICYEDVFAEVDASRLVKAAYLVNVTNDGWFGNSIEPYQHMQIARMRALESGRYLIRATNTGLTGIVGPDGTLLHQLPLFKTKVLTAEIVPMGGLTPITKIGESKVIYLLVIILLAIFLKNSIQKKSFRH